MTRIDDLCHTHVSHKWLYHLDASTRAQCLCVDHSWTRNLSTEKACSTAEATRGHHACVHASLGGQKLADPGITTESRTLTEAQSSSADLFTTAAVPGRSAALDVCVASSHEAAARGDAAQAAYGRIILHYRQEIPDLRAQGIVCRLVVWTADGPVEHR